MKFSLPQPILAFVSNCEVRRDRVGESPARVYRFNRKNDLFFLKISRKIYSPTTFGVTREAQVLEWLQGRLNVPELVRHAANDRWECMITRSVPGRPLSA
jgi:kanamycin kinase